MSLILRDFRFDGESRSRDAVGFVSYCPPFEASHAGVENGFGVQHVTPCYGKILEHIVVDGVEEGCD